MLHFTYAEPKLDQLRQGDILRKTPELLDLIKAVHPHYANEDYRYFQVLTQSCDLVRRGGKDCKSRYITLAAVRPMSLIVERALDGYERKFVFDNKLFCSATHRRALKDLFVKLFNNNDTQNFFLKSSPDYGLDVDCCTQLHLSIAIRAYEHYDLCLQAKILELKDEFRAKLGWLVGNLYSRVGTQDYVPGAISDERDFEEFVQNSMDQYVVWLPEKEYATYQKQHTKVASFEEMQGKVATEMERKQKTKLDSIVSAITAVLPGEVDEETKSALRNTLSRMPLLNPILNG
ncbi:hypothetical protein ACTHR6_26305 [Ralstonia holmesii]|uniref:hypothetical protein n=1 Tax=Ralstonia TaxID=48736 RepID=UPI00046A9488|nr:hypothetical protein [Ralstonia pickettii]